ncbi:hypothetical protein WME91_53430 [Sorangium sp. So ce269]
MLRRTRPSRVNAVQTGPARPSARARSPLEATLYMGAEGTLLRHDWILDEVDVLGEDPIEYLERRLVSMESS